MSTASRLTSRISSDIFFDVSMVVLRNLRISLSAKLFNVDEMLLFRNPVCQIMFSIESTFFTCIRSVSSNSGMKREREEVGEFVEGEISFLLLFALFGSRCDILIGV